MRLAGIAGLMAMLVLLLSAAAASDETPVERQVRTYLQSDSHYRVVLGVSDEAALGRITCGRAGRPDALICVLSVDDKGLDSHRYIVLRGPHGAFDFHQCPRGQFSAPLGYRTEEDPCADEIDPG